MENDVRGSQTGLWTTGWEPSFMNICSERCAAVKQSERVTLLCLSLTCVCVCLSSLLSQGEADSRPRQWNSHDQPEGVTALPGKHDSVWNILTSSNTSLHSLEFFFFLTCLWLNMSWCAELLPKWMMSDTILTVCFLDPYPVSCACGGLRVSHPVIPP